MAGARGRPLSRPRRMNISIVRRLATGEYLGQPGCCCWGTWIRTRTERAKTSPAAGLPHTPLEPAAGLEPAACPLQEGRSAPMS